MKHAGRTVRIGSFEFDPDLGELRKEGVPVHLQPQPAQVLTILLSRPGLLVSREELRKKIWNDRIVEFDAGLNYSIRQIRAAFGDSSDSPSYIETIPRRGYRFIAAVEDSRAAESTPASTGVRKDGYRLGALAILISLVLMGVIWNGSRNGSAPAAVSRRVMLAVLPFQEFSGDRSMKIFAGGLTEDLITELANLNPAKLGVIAYTSVQSFADEVPTNAELRKTLGVDYVLRGAIRQSGTSLRVTIRLEDTAEGSPVWAHRFDQQTSHELASQVEIARGVAESLSLEVLGTRPAAKLADLPREVRESLLLSRWLLDQRTQSSTEQALKRLDRIRISAPDSAMAWALTARGQRALGLLEDAKSSARRAIEADPEFAEGHQELGNALSRELRLQEALAPYRRAVTLSPGIARYHTGLAHTLADLLRFDEAIEHLEIARELDPVSTSIDVDLALLLIAAGRGPEAVHHCVRGAELMPDSVWPHSCLLAAHYFTGDSALARKSALKIMDLRSAAPEDIDAVREPDPASGMIAYFNWQLRWLRAEAEQGRSAPPYRFAQAYGALRDRDRTLAALRQVAESRSYESRWMAREIWFAFLHEDFEFRKILADLELPSTPSSSPGGTNRRAGRS